MGRPAAARDIARSHTGWRMIHTAYVYSVSTCPTDQHEVNDDMAMRFGLLTLLADEPAHGYELKTGLERAVGGSWAINVGQVYSTLRRLERDGLVAEDEATLDHRDYRITAAGREELDRWFAAPYQPDTAPRDELTAKVLLAIASRDVDVRDLLQHQRSSIVSVLQAYTRRKAAAGPDDLAHADDARRAHLPGRGRGPLARRVRRPPCPARRASGPRHGRERASGRRTRGVTVRRATRHRPGHRAARRRADLRHRPHPGGGPAADGPVRASGRAGRRHGSRAARASRPSCRSWVASTVHRRARSSWRGRPRRRWTARGLALLRRRTVGYVFQELNLLAGLTAAENVSLPLELDGVGAGPGPDRRPLEALDRVGVARTWPTGSRTTCRAASSSASPSPARSWAAGGSCSPMSRRAHSIRSTVRA